jgi:prepilin-type N-terminal cleavage/methylation domain-containing protein
MARLLQRSRKLGFTLVELLIVVAIIGVLSTIGVPTFKRMVQKAKKSEAKVALGGIYTSEMAFFSEYGGFGNNLKGVGFEFEGSTALYTIGFPDNACAGAGAAVPLVNNTIGAQINSTYGAYYANFTNTSSIAGRVGAGANVCLASTIENDGGYFVATATGCVAAGCVGGSAAGAVTIDPNTGSINGSTAANGNINQDSWAIDRNRRLVNVTDGVK